MIEDASIIEEFKRLTLETLNHERARGILVGLVGELVDKTDGLEKIANNGRIGGEER